MVTGQHAPQRGMLLSLACSSAWHAPQCGIFLSRPLWSCSVCLCTQRRCNAYWSWSEVEHIFGKVGDEFVVLPGYPESAECE